MLELGVVGEREGGLGVFKGRVSAWTSSRVDGMVRVWSLGSKHGAPGAANVNDQDSNPTRDFIISISTLMQLLVALRKPQFLQIHNLTSTYVVRCIESRHKVAPTPDQTPGLQLTFAASFDSSFDAPASSAVPHSHPLLPTMSKSPRDSTRFTPTGVWAHQRPGNRATTLQFADPAPKNETPQQKVKRLREAANRAKLAQVTRWDYMYLYGRMAADAVHRFTVYGIIFTTGMGSAL